MSGVATSNRTRVALGRARRLVPVLIVAALLAAVPSGGTSRASVVARDVRRTTLDRAHAFAVADAAATKPQSQERRDTPFGAVPGLAVVALGALAGTIVARTRRRTFSEPRLTFRRRAPPILRTAF